jgi:hypothetical protein
MSSPNWDISSEAITAEDFRNEVVAYFQMRLFMMQHSRTKESKILASEFRYQVDFWRNVKLPPKKA